LTFSGIANTFHNSFCCSKTTKPVNSSSPSPVAPPKANHNHIHHINFYGKKFVPLADVNKIAKNDKSSQSSNTGSKLSIKQIVESDKIENHLLIEIKTKLKQHEHTQRIQEIRNRHINNVQDYKLSKGRDNELLSALTITNSSLVSLKSYLKKQQEELYGLYCDLTSYEINPAMPNSSNIVLSEKFVVIENKENEIKLIEDKIVKANEDAEFLQNHPQIKDSKEEKAEMAWYKRFQKKITVIKIEENLNSINKKIDVVAEVAEHKLMKEEDKKGFDKKEAIEDKEINKTIKYIKSNISEATKQLLNIKKRDSIEYLNTTIEKLPLNDISYPKLDNDLPTSDFYNAYLDFSNDFPIPGILQCMDENEIDLLKEIDLKIHKITLILNLIPVQDKLFAMQTSQNASKNCYQKLYPSRSKVDSTYYYNKLTDLINSIKTSQSYEEIKKIEIDTFKRQVELYLKAKKPRKIKKTQKLIDNLNSKQLHSDKYILKVKEIQDKILEKERELNTIKGQKNPTGQNSQENNIEQLPQTLKNEILEKKNELKKIKEHRKQNTIVQQKVNELLRSAIKTTNPGITDIKKHDPDPHVMEEKQLKAIKSSITALLERPEFNKNQTNPVQEDNKKEEANVAAKADAAERKLMEEEDKATTQFQAWALKNNVTLIQIKQHLLEWMEEFITQEIIDEKEKLIPYINHSILCQKEILSDVEKIRKIVKRTDRYIDNYPSAIESHIENTIKMLKKPNNAVTSMNFINEPRSLEQISGRLTLIQAQFRKFKKLKNERAAKAAVDAAAKAAVATAAAAATAAAVAEAAATAAAIAEVTPSEATSGSESESESESGAPELKAEIAKSFASDVYDNLAAKTETEAEAKAVDKAVEKAVASIEAKAARSVTPTDLDLDSDSDSESHSTSLTIPLFPDDSTRYDITTLIKALENKAGGNYQLRQSTIVVTAPQEGCSKLEETLNTTKIAQTFPMIYLVPYKFKDTVNEWCVLKINISQGSVTYTPIMPHPKMNHLLNDTDIKDIIRNVFCDCDQQFHEKQSNPPNLYTIQNPGLATALLILEEKLSESFINAHFKRRRTTKSNSVEEYFANLAKIAINLLEDTTPNSSPKKKNIQGTTYNQSSPSPPATPSPPASPSPPAAPSSPAAAPALPETPALPFSTMLQLLVYPTTPRQEEINNQIKNDRAFAMALQQQEILAAPAPAAAAAAAAAPPETIPTNLNGVNYDYERITIFGDGNCFLNAFVLLLLDLGKNQNKKEIIMEKLEFKEEAFDLYNNKNNHIKLQKELCGILKSKLAESVLHLIATEGDNENSILEAIKFCYPQYRQNINALVEDIKKDHQFLGLECLHPLMNMLHNNGIRFDDSKTEDEDVPALFGIDESGVPVQCNLGAPYALYNMDAAHWTLYKRLDVPPSPPVVAAAPTPAPDRNTNQNMLIKLENDLKFLESETT